MKKGKVVIFSAPSGSGKSTLVHFLMKQDSSFGFSVSATSRPPRGEEKHGVDYYFFTADEFRARIAADEFVEYEEVYPGRFYGTLKSQVEQQLERQNILFDVDVLRERLIGRGDTSMEEIEKRVGKAEYEMTFAKFADRVIVNDDLDKAKRDLMEVVEKFLNE